MAAKHTVGGCQRIFRRQLIIVDDDQIIWRRRLADVGANVSERGVKPPDFAMRLLRVDAGAGYLLPILLRNDIDR